ncbi:ATP-binding protein [Mesorhizobium sp. M0615]|uniref:ATP-binding protein n=1 Tax=Mesorhizobium sp. M0615 TaxID=2956971 RepID=UPI00333924DD
MAFAVRAIADADAPEKLRKHLQTEGWEPVPVGVAISDPKSVIKLLGGRLLYESDGLSVPLRELIQNASDAVRARRALTDDHTSYSGKILIELEPANENESWISVRDNGIGMSPRVLTGALVDFGKSLWRSSDVVEELPGFARTGIEQSGRYGIGFFSLMMATDRLTVSSRPYHAGLSEIKSLDFPDGLLGPCVLYSGSDVAIGDEYSSIVRFLVKNESIEEFLYVETNIDWDDAGEMADLDKLQLSWQHRIWSMTPTLDCSVFFRTEGQSYECHTEKWYDESADTWLEKAELVEARRISRQGETFDLDQCAKAIRLIKEDGVVKGRAAISPISSGGIGSFALHGFNTGDPSIARYGSTRQFIGVLPVKAEGPRRLSEVIDLQESTLLEWASDQATIWATADISESTKHKIATCVSEYGGDSSDLANIPVNGEYTSLTAFCKMLTSSKKVIFPKERKGSAFVNFVGSIDNDRHSLYRFNVTDYFEPTENEHVCTLRFSSSEPYFSLSADTNGSFLQMARKCLNSHGYELFVESRDGYLIGRYKESFHFVIDKSLYGDTSKEIATTVAIVSAIPMDIASSTAR